jgi:hypothetical protein
MKFTLPTLSAPSVDSVMAGFTETIRKLEAVQVQQQRRSVVLQEEAAVLKQQATAANEEACRAASMVSRLNKLLGA